MFTTEDTVKVVLLYTEDEQQRVCPGLGGHQVYRGQSQALHEQDQRGIYW